jgi:HD-like signal output (HDOD) protein/ActR/RegA family two-component response regulator
MLEPLQVLVIAPDVNERALHLRAIERLGHLANSLGRPAEAAQRRGHRPPAVILFTPESWADGGAALIDELRERQGLSRTILIGDQRTIARSPEVFEQGIQRFLQTPLSTAELEEAINEVMAGPPARQLRPEVDGEGDDDASDEGADEGVAEQDPEAVRQQIVDLAAKLRDGSAVVSNISPVAMELQALCSDSGTHLPELVAKIEQDHSLATAVIKASNAAAYRGMPSVLDLTAAGRRLGTRRLAEVAQMESLKGAFASKSTGWSKLLSKMWRNTVTTAFAARALVERLGYPNRGEVYTMALFHNLGEILIVDIHQKLGTAPPKKGMAAGGLARDMQNQHAELGALLMRSWKLPATLAAIAYAHHQPGRLDSGTPLARHAWLIGGVQRAVCDAGYSYMQGEHPGPSVAAAAGVLGIDETWFQEAAEAGMRAWTGSEE